MNTRNYLRKAVMYQLFWRAFTPEGTIKSAEKLLPHIASLGVDIVYTTPFTESDDDERREYWSNRQKKSGTENPKNPYRLKDYFKIDPEYGNDEDFLSFVNTAHSLGLMVMTDLVYLHCGPTCPLIDEHPEYFARKDDGSLLTNEYNFPVFDFSRTDVRNYFSGNMLYFVEKFGVDGYRCDCGDAIPLDFWENSIKEVRKLNPDFILFNEGHKPEYLDVFDYDYDWEPLSAYGEGSIEKTNGHPDAEIYVQFCKAEDKIGHHGMHARFFENHDRANDAYDNRLEKRIGGDGVEALTFLYFFTDGVPFIYNGFEIADNRRHSIMGNRFCGNNLVIDWSWALTEKGRKRMEFIRQLTSFKHTQRALQNGENVWLDNTSPHSVLSFTRSDGDETILVIVNIENKACRCEISLPFAQGSELMERRAVLEDCGSGKISASLGSYGFVAIKITKK